VNRFGSSASEESSVCLWRTIGVDRAGLEDGARQRGELDDWIDDDNKVGVDDGCACCVRLEWDGGWGKVGVGVVGIVLYLAKVPPRV
jgi:hypothetical protein